MDGEAPRATESSEKNSLSPGDRLRSDRAESPTPGLVEGTEPGETDPESASYGYKQQSASHQKLNFTNSWKCRVSIFHKWMNY